MKHPKRSFLYFFALTSLCSAEVEFFREWQSKDDKKKTIKAAIIAKSLDGKKLQFRFEDRNAFWYEADKFADKHQNYFKNWVKPREHLAVLLKKHGSGKLVKIIATAGSQKLRVDCYSHYKGKVKMTRWVEPGQSKNFDFKASNEYVIKAYWGKRLVDKESWIRKTGA